MYYLQSSGFYEFALPFLLVFTVTYAVFSYAKSQAKNGFVLDKRAIAMLSVIIGFFATAYEPLRRMLFTFMPYFIIFLIIIFILLIISKLFGEEKDNKDWLPVMLILISIVIIIGTIGMPDLKRILGRDAKNIIWAVGIGIFLMMLWIVRKIGT